MTAAYDAIVYDLDGTLVELDVDWDAARDDAAAVLSARGVDTAGMGLWAVLEAAEPNGVLERVNEAIAKHEREGARTARRLPLADELPRDVPVGVCSLNSEAACRIALELHGLDGHVEIALELHGLDGHVDAVIGRDSTGAYKPDPQPLLETVRAIGGEPARTLFVGDGERDAITAERAGLPFQYVADRLE